MIKIDLRDLTDTHLAEALPHMGTFTYRAPCIIGTLIPEDQRQSIYGSVVTLVNRYKLKLPYGQLELAQRLQYAFDARDMDRFNRCMEEVRSLPR